MYCLKENIEKLLTNTTDFGYMHFKSILLNH